MLYTALMLLFFCSVAVAVVGLISLLVCFIMKKKVRWIKYIVLGAVVVAFLSTATAFRSLDKEEPQIIEVPYSQLEAISDDLFQSVSDSLKNLSSAEIYGMSTDDNEQTIHMREVYDSYMDAALENCLIKQGQKVVVSGYFGSAHIVEDDSWLADVGKVAFSLKKEPDDSEWNCMLFKSNDLSILDIEEGTPIKILGTFMKQGTATGAGDVLFDCEVVPNDINAKKVDFSLPTRKD